MAQDLEKFHYNNNTNLGIYVEYYSFTSKMQKHVARFDKYFSATAVRLFCIRFALWDTFCSKIEHLDN